jgi:excisionase family DNA binding protein
MQDATHDAGHEAGVTLAEAASILGCSVDTVRRRIRRGELHAVQDAGRHGPTWKVLLGVTPSSVSAVSSTPSVSATTPSVSATTPSTAESDAGLLEALRMLDAIRHENRDLAGQVGYLQARVQLHEETIRALTAPAETPVAAQPALQPATVATRTATPLWRRMWPLALGLVYVVLSIALLAWPR